MYHWCNYLYHDLHNFCPNLATHAAITVYRLLSGLQNQIPVLQGAPDDSLTQSIFLTLVLPKRTYEASRSAREQASDVALSVMQTCPLLVSRKPEKLKFMLACGFQYILGKY